MDQVRYAVGKTTRLGITLRVYAYEIDGLLIDTGSKSAFFQMKEFFQKSDVQQIALTHIHEDHSGNSHWWWKKKNIPSYVHKDSVHLAEKDAILPFYRKMYWGKRKPFKALPLPKIIETENYKFHVIETPGHSDDSVSFYEKSNGWLFTGDLFITEKPRLFFYEESIPKTIDSLQKLLKLDVETLYCAHSGKISNGSKRLRNKLDFLLDYQEKVIAMHQKGMSEGEIIQELHPQKTPMTFFSGGEFAQDHGIKSIIQNI